MELTPHNTMLDGGLIQFSSMPVERERERYQRLKRTIRNTRLDGKPAPFELIGGSWDGLL